MPEPYTEDFLLHRLLDTKRGRCAALVSLYLSLAYRLDLPFNSYCVPEHILIRAGSGDQAVNLETTLQGIVVPDAKYVPMVANVAQLKQDPFYMQRQTRKQCTRVF